MAEESGLMRQLAAAQERAKTLPTWKRLGVEVDDAEPTQAASADSPEEPKPLDLK